MGHQTIQTFESSVSVTSSLPQGDRATGPGEVALSVKGVSKAFGATQALRDVDLELRRGRVHALLGENGSGKSTLVKILSGVHRPDAGAFTLGAEPHPFPRSPRAAIASGTATTFQEVLVATSQSVLTNLWMGSDGILRRRQTARGRREQAAEMLGRLIEPPDLSVPVKTLSLSERQAVCIARSLLTEPRVLILDEATSALDVDTCLRLFELVRELRGRDVAILFISHRMDEIAEIADDVTVLVSGRLVASKPTDRTTADELVALMTGEDKQSLLPEQRPGARSRRTPSVGLEARGVRLRDGGEPISVTIAPGEITGLAGLEGHGQDAFLQILAGGPSRSGDIVLRDGETRRSLASRADALERGVVYVPRDRRDESLLESRSILDNFALATTRRDRRWGLVRLKALRERFEPYAANLHIVAGERTNPITSLSGGNQQKVVLARWLARHPRVLLLNDPTRGVDINAKRDIYRLLRDSADDGLIVVMVSTEVVELVELTDRVLVFRSGALSRDMRASDITAGSLIGAYFGRAA